MGGVGRQLPPSSSTTLKGRVNIKVLCPCRHGAGCGETDGGVQGTETGREVVEQDRGRRCSTLLLGDTGRGRWRSQEGGLWSGRWRGRPWWTSQGATRPLDGPVGMDGREGDGGQGGRLRPPHQTIPAHPLKTHPNYQLVASRETSLQYNMK